MKKCKSCNKPLRSFVMESNGVNHQFYTHPDNSCSGITDAVSIEMTVIDEGLQEAFENIYGKPDKDDYEVRIELEKELEELKIKHLRLEATIEGNRLLRWLVCRAMKTLA